MTQVFQEDGRVERVTVLEAGPCPVLAIRTHDVDGYEAVQLAFDAVSDRKLSKGELGHLRKAGVGGHRHLVEHRRRRVQDRAAPDLALLVVARPPESHVTTLTYRPPVS